MENYTEGPWVAKRDPYTGRNYFIEGKGNSVIAIIPLSTDLSKVPNSERFANMRLIESCPVIFESLCIAHDLCLDGYYRECIDLLLETINMVREDRVPENY